MEITRLHISNWRSIAEIELQISSLAILIGQNNHGKSNVLSAVLFFFGEIRHQDLDFHHGAEELFVECTFSHLNDVEKTTFQKYVTTDGHIVVRKTAFLGGSFQYNGFLEVPTDPSLQEANAGNYTRREAAANEIFSGHLPATGRLSKQNIIDAQAAYIAANRDSVELNYEIERNNFLGLKSVAKGMFGDVFYVPAVKEAADEYNLRDTSAFGRLYSEVIALISNEDQNWRTTKENMESLFSKLNRLDDNGNVNTDRPIHITEFEAELSVELSAWGAAIDIEVSSPDIDSVFKANTQVWVNDGYRTDIRRKGHGLQRAMTMALVRVVANRLSANPTAPQDATVEARPARVASKSRYFIFEEPELYLHPQAQRALYESIVELSESDDSQVLMCTHSSALIDIEQYNSIHIVSKPSAEASSAICSCADELFEGNAKKDFNLSYWINPDRGELFFAKKVVLVEGPTDKTVVPMLAKLLDIFRHDYSVIDCGSKTSIPLYISLLNKFSIPYVAVYDVDRQEHKTTEALASADIQTQAILDCVNPQVGSAVAFDNDIEEELGLPPGTSNKPYVALNHIANESFVMSQRLIERVQQIYAHEV